MTIKISQLANLTVVQANTVIPVVSNITGTLATFQANVQQLQDYIVANGVSANITALYTNAATQSDLIIGINSNVTQANLGMKGYVDSISGSESIANVNMKGYVDGQITAANAGVTTANIGIIGYINLGNTTTRNYIDGQITAANAGVTAANVGIIGYIDLANTSMKSYVDGQITAANAGVTSANVGMKGYVDNQTYSNVQTLAFLVTNTPLYEGNIGVNVNVTNGTVTASSFVGDGSQLTNLPGGGSSNYSNVNVAAYLNTQGYNLYSNVNVAVFTSLSTYAYNANVTAANVGVVGYVDNAVSTANIGMKGYVDSVASQSIYGNANVASYLITNGYVNTNSAYANSNVKSYLTGGFDGNIIPSANITYSLGSETNQWKDLWVSGNTIHIGGSQLSVADNGLSINGSKINASKSAPANAEGRPGDTIGDVAIDEFKGNAYAPIRTYFCKQTYTGEVIYSGINAAGSGPASGVLTVAAGSQANMGNVRVGWIMYGSPIVGNATVTSITRGPGSPGGAPAWQLTINQAVDLRFATNITLQGRPAIWLRSAVLDDWGTT